MVAIFALDREGIDAAMVVMSKAFEDFRWSIHYDDDTTRVAVFCSKTPHCLYDLLLRQRMGELNEVPERDRSRDGPGVSRSCSVECV